MLVHLSNTSPYVCDLNRGPIEQANRMASAPTKKATALLEQKESFPKQTRPPLKLLAPDEILLDTTITTTDVNASLQPVWYTEQTIVDDHHAQQEDIASIIQEQQQGLSSLARTTLSPIESESLSTSEEIEELPNQPSLMHKSSTFTIELTSNVDSLLNDSEKENVMKEDTIIATSDDSFRALEQLLGLGSATTVRESPKTNHDTLSLTVVTPTDIINSTRRSSRLSYAQKGGAGSLPSSQEIPTMPTIESITSTEPPSFLMDNTAMDDEQPFATTTTNQQTSFDITDNDTIKDDSNNDDETNFSFELNDFPNNSNNEPAANVSTPPEPMVTIRAPTCADVAYRALIKPRTGGRVSQPVKADSPLAKQNKLRSSAPTSRALRSSCRRISSDSPSQNLIGQEQPSSTNPECFVNDINTNTELFEIVTLPEEDEDEQETTSSATLNISSSKEPEEINSDTCSQPEQIITPPKPLMPVLSREYTYDTPNRRSSQRSRSTLKSLYATPIQQQQSTINEEETDSPSVVSNSMLEILLTKPTEVNPKMLPKTSIAPSPVRTLTSAALNEQASSSPSVTSQSMLQVLLTQPTEAEPKVTGRKSIVPSPVRTSKRNTTHSLSIASRSMLEVLLTKPAEAEPIAPQNTSIVPSPVRNTMQQQAPNSPSIASQSMLEVLLTKPTEIEPKVSRTISIVPSPVRSSKRNTINQQATNSPSIASKSMLAVLLTNPTEIESNVVQETSIASSPVQVATRKSGRASSNATPRASINPLHSSTPSSSRHKSLQMVSIGEQEQVLTTVPQQINIEIEQEQPDIEMVPLNDTEESIPSPSTIEIGVQTTPSLDISTRRRLNTTQQQAIPIVQMDQSSTVMIDEQQERQITPLQTKVTMNLQRIVRFQLTPVTDARLVAKEQFEENLRGLKPDIVIDPTPIVAEVKQDKVKTVPIKKATKPKKKVLTSRKKKAEPKSPSTPKRVRKEKPSKQKTTRATKVSKKKIAVTPPTKRVARKRTVPEVTAKPVVKRAPPKRTNTKATTNTIAKRVARKAGSGSIAKRTARKRTIPQAAIESIIKEASTKRTTTEATIKPIAKRSSRKQITPKAKTEPVVAKRTPSKGTLREAKIEPVAQRASIKRPIPEATIEPVTKRVKTSKPVEVKKQPIEASLPPSGVTRTRNGSTNNTKNLSKPAPAKASKRRLQSVEKTEESNKKVQPIAPIQNTELNHEERHKIEALTVAQLKSRLNTHKEEVPKGAKKADLIALLIKLEINSLKKHNEIPTPTVDTTAKTSRLRRKK